MPGSRLVPRPKPFSGAAFGATGVGAATAAGIAAAVSAGSVPACGLVGAGEGEAGGVDVFTAGVSLAVVCAVATATLAVGSTAGTVDVTAVPAAPGSVLVCAGAAAIETSGVTDWLAAIAAAAIASGAVPGPDVAGAVGAAGTATKVTGTGIATAIAFGAAVGVVSGEGEAVAGSAAAEASDDDDLAVDLVPSACGPMDFPGGGKAVTVVAPAPAAGSGATSAS